MRKFVFLPFVVIFVFVCATSLHAQVGDEALFTIQVSPDALIPFDLSRSMWRPPGGDWGYSNSKSGDVCNGDRLYYTPTGAYNIWCTNSDSNTTPDPLYRYSASPACTEPYYRESNKPSPSYDCSKIAISKRVIFDLLDDNNDNKLSKEDQESLNTRFAYMRFIGCCSERLDSDLNYRAGCNTLQFDFPASNDPKDFNYSGLNSKIQGETIPRTGFSRTPLAAQLREAKKYLDDHKATDAAAACRKKFIVLITDGWDTCACGMKCPDEQGGYTSPEPARRRATLAAVKPAADAGYRVFVVGFGADMPQTERNTLEWCAFYGGTDNPKVDNSGNTSAITPDPEPCRTGDSNDPGSATLRGYAFLATDATQLAESLRTIIRYIWENSFSYTAPTIPVVRLVDNDVVFISSFIPNDTPFWRGNLKAYRLNVDGTLPVDENGNPLSANLLWDAFEKLETLNPDSRNIYTAKSGVPGTPSTAFTIANIAPEDLGLSTGDTAGRNALVNHVRGIDAYDIDLDLNVTENRRWKLGDIFHSNAVIVGEPNRYFEDNTEIGTEKNPGYSGATTAYQGFYNDYKNRKRVLVVGANDGMLHIFDAATGSEVGAFIPPSVLKNLKTIKTSWDQYKATQAPQPHLYFVDATPRVAAVWFYSSPTDTTKDKSEWRTVLVSGLRKGGKTYFALDLTNTESAQGFLWEFPTDAPTLAKMGQSWSDPAIGRVKVEVGGKIYERWVAFIGGGYDPTGATGKAFFVVDLKTGRVIKEFSGLPGMTHGFAAAPKAVDTNGDGYIDKVYCGDLGGQMWVFDVSFVYDQNTKTYKSDSRWNGKILIKLPGTPAEKHPIYYQPAVTFDKYSNVWVFFGTGDREAPLDTSMTPQGFYGVKDDGKTYNLTRGDLMNLTGMNYNSFKPVSDLGYQGWYLRLEDKGEKVLAKATVFNQLVYFTTYSPKDDPNNPCNVGGTARLYIVEYLSGGGALNVDELSDLEGGPSASRWRSIGSGIPSDAVISVNQKGQATLIIGTTRSQVYSQQAFSPTTNREFLYWREVIPNQ